MQAPDDPSRDPAPGEPVYVVGAQKYRLPDDVFAQLSAHAKAELANAGRVSYDDRLVGHMHAGEQVGTRDALPEMLKAVFCLLGRRYVARMAQLNGMAAQGRMEILFKDSWIVRARAGDYNPAHMHDGDLAGIVYLEVPPQARDARTRDGQLDFLFGQLNPRNMEFLGVRSVVPQAGDVYLFPAWLHHMVYPFRGDGDRISYSFNLEVRGLEVRTFQPRIKGAP